MTNGFSGRSMGSLSIMDKEKYREGYGPFLENCGHIGFNDVDDLRAKVGDTTAAVFLEFIQGEGGIVPVSQEFVSALNSLRNQFGFLIVADEIQSGIMRTGKFFAFEHFDFHPDIVTIAKPIGGGLPLGAILGKRCRRLCLVVWRPWNDIRRKPRRMRSREGGDRYIDN